MRFDENASGLVILILNWNNAPATLRCLDMISGWNRLKVEVIVVDNSSSDEDLALLGQAGTGFRLLQNNSNLGYAGGINVGISLALKEGFPFIMLLNSDAVIGEQCVSKQMECLSGSSDLGVIGPLCVEHGTIYSGGRNIGVYSNTRIPYDPADTGSILLPVDYVPGTALIARREAFEKIGLLDEEYFFSGEIADFCKRLHSSGLQCAVYCGCQATHTPDRNSAIRETIYNYYTLRNRFLFVRRHFHYSRGIFFIRWIAGGFVQIILALIRNRGRRARALWLGLRDGVSGRFGDRNDLFLD